MNDGVQRDQEHGPADGIEQKRQRQSQKQPDPAANAGHDAGDEAKANAKQHPQQRVESEQALQGADNQAVIPGSGPLCAGRVGRGSAGTVTVRPSAAAIERGDQAAAQCLLARKQCSELFLHFRSTHRIDL